VGYLSPLLDLFPFQLFILSFVIYARTDLCCRCRGFHYYLFPRTHSQLCGIWHLHFYGNTFRGLGRNYFPISSPVNRKFYCSCIRSRVCGPLSPIFFFRGCWGTRTRRHQQPFGKYIAVTTSHITHQYPARPRPPTHSAPSRRFTHKQKQ